ncbi:helix-turn-helix transcriptional regulator [Emcibacter nanhaiensis]|nr:helix-turn-helix transcriptional regulator [Emcibacter nanhaiensis]
MLDLGQLVSALGQENFLSCLSKVLEEIVHTDHLTLYIFDARWVPQMVDGISRNNSGITSKLAALYEKSHFYQYDPNLKLLGSKKEHPASPLLVQTHAEDIENPAYRSEIYQKHGLLDRLSLLDHSSQGWFTFNLYRDISSSYFQPDEVDRLGQISRFLFSFIRKHLDLRPPAAWKSTTVPPVEQLEMLVGSLGHSLSKREIEVCARILRGQTREGVALDLGIKTPTVATLLQRAYAKLNISSLNELFALCLGKMGSSGL